MARKKKDAEATPRKRRGKKADETAVNRTVPPWEQPEGSVGAPQMQPGTPEPITLQKGKKILAKITEWMDLQKQVAEFAPIVDREMELRKELASTIFTAPREGTNYCDLPDGWKLRYVHNLDRKFEQPAMAPVFAQLPAGTADYLIKWHPYLNLENFRAMQRAQPDSVQVLEQCLITKPGTVKLELVPPATPE